MSSHWSARTRVSPLVQPIAAASAWVAGFTVTSCGEAVSCTHLHSRSWNHCVLVLTDSRIEGHGRAQGLPQKQLSVPRALVPHGVGWV